MRRCRNSGCSNAAARCLRQTVGLARCSLSSVLPTNAGSGASVYAGRSPTGWPGSAPTTRVPLAGGHSSAMRRSPPY